MTATPTLLGSVESVRGASVDIRLDEGTVSGLTFVDGHGYRVGQIGSFVRIPIGLVDLFGIVSQVGAAAVPDSLTDTQPYGNRWLTVELIGEAAAGAPFRRGLARFPTVADEAHLVTQNDLRRLYGQLDSPSVVRIGGIASAEGIPALLDINPLLTRHSAIVGSTGAGKSTTVARIIEALSSAEYPSARVMVLDVHGEYAKAFAERATVLRVNPQRVDDEQLRVPFWAMTFDELVSISFGVIDDEASRAAVLEHVLRLKRASLAQQPRSGIDEQTLTVDAPVPFSIHQLWYDLHREVFATHTAQASGQSAETEAIIKDGDAERVLPPVYQPQNLGAGTKIYLSGSPLRIRRQIDALGGRLRDRRFDFLFSPGPWMPAKDGEVDEDLDTLLEAWVGADRPVTVVDLSGTPPTVLEEVVGALLRIVYDALFWARDLAEGARERPLLVVLEEAHAYLNRGLSSPASTIVQRIVKEGRKYGFGAMIVSQRPSEIDQTILSQCGTIVAMRLANATDRRHVVGTVSDNLEGLLAMLPVLRTGEAIAVGEAVNLPMRVLVEPPQKDRRPQSSDPLVFVDEYPGGWNRPRGPEDYAEVIAVWRRQNPRSSRLVEEETANAPDSN